MNGAFDTNILIDYLNGIADADTELRRYAHRSISRIVRIEVLCGALGSPQEGITRSFLSTFSIVELDEEIAVEAIRIRQELRLKLPGAIVLATARRIGTSLVTRNTKDFDVNWSGVRVPYEKV